MIPGPGITISRREIPFNGSLSPAPEEKEETEGKDKSAFDFTLVETEDPGNKSQKAAEDPRSHIRTQVLKEADEKKKNYDFSPITPEEPQFSDEIEKIIEKIVTYKEENGIDTQDNVKRWKITTLEIHGMKLLELYGSLFRRSDEAGTWNVFFKEPLVKKMLYNPDFRNKIRTFYPDGSKSRIRIEELIDEFEDQLALAAAEQEEQQIKQAGKSQIAAASLIIFGVVLFITFLSFLYFNNR